MTSKLTSVFSTLLVLLLASTLSACKPAKNDQEKKAIADPNVVELTPALQEKIQLVKVGEAEIREVLRMPGSIQVDEQRVARIGAPVTGRITDIDAVLGQQVKQGQTLATLNSTELAQNQLVYIKALQQIDLHSKAVERARTLLEADVISKAELQRREAELSAAQAELNAAADQLQVLGMSTQGIAKLSKTSAMHSFSNVIARISGTVINRRIQKQENIHSNWAYRQYMQHNGLQIMKYNGEEACYDLGLSPHVYTDKTPSNNVPYLYKNTYDHSRPGYGYSNSDLKNPYLSREQLNARLIAP
ncbi:MAG: biotin/lipoyl-binding protein, partial [Methylophilaceae bacterium]|nr:biotin/lipoyl-binding protein [Methylophilaceae bacterium]